MTPLSDEAFEKTAAIIPAVLFENLRAETRDGIDAFIADARWHRAEVKRLTAALKPPSIDAVGGYRAWVGNREVGLTVESIPMLLKQGDAARADLAKARAEIEGLQAALYDIIKLSRGGVNVGEFIERLSEIHDRAESGLAAALATKDG